MYAVPVYTDAFKGFFVVFSSDFVDRYSEAAIDNEAAIDVHRLSEPTPLLIDKYQMKQALSNIIRNSFDSMAAGGKVKINVEPGEAGVRFAEIRISDTGQGIPEEDIGHIVEPFFSKRKNHLGLGLSIAERVIRNHHGEMEIMSPHDGGTLTIVRLPVEDNSTPIAQDRREAD